jgi:hypothetical protein
MVHKRLPEARILPDNSVTLCGMGKLIKKGPVWLCGFVYAEDLASTEDLAYSPGD